MAMTAKCINLKGDPRAPESAQHIITFPGGAVELTRCSNGVDYWVHVSVHTGQTITDIASESRGGRITDSRIDRDNTPEIEEITNMESINHIAFLVSTTNHKERT